MRTLSAILAVVIIASVEAQQAPAIEAVSIKRNTSGNAGGGIGPRPGGYAAINVPVHLFIGLAHAFQGMEIEGAPDWFYDDAYDLTARISGNPSPEESRALWRQVFFERMRLRAHVETREQPIYALILARSGQLSPSLVKADTDCTAAAAPPQCTRLGRTGLSTEGMSMAALARFIQPTTGRVVLDRTGLDGMFKFVLTFTPTRPNASVDPARAGSDLPTVFTALPEQLGLRLEATRGPVDVLVIDHIERPTED